MSIAEKPPQSRQMVVMLGVVMIAVVIVSATLGFLFFSPATRVDEAAAEAEQAAIADLPVVEGRQAAAQVVAQAEAEAADRAATLERLRQQETPVAPPPAGRGADDRLPAFDPELLEALAEADAAVGQPPRLTGGTDRVINPGAAAEGGLLGAPGAPGAVMAMGKFEAYDEPRPREDAAAQAAAEPFEALNPRHPPSARVIAQGSMLRGVLLTRIDTRNSGDVVAQITSDVYDSATVSKLLIPRGSRLLGTYETDVVPGNPRISVAFRRLMFPDGRAIELPEMLAVGNDGVSGVEGRYRSNLLRAIGPSIMVTLIGAWADEETRPAAQTAAPFGGGVVQSPTVVQQTIPQINEAIMRRFEGAAPFFIAEPGTSLKVMLNADLEIPLAGDRP